MTMIDDGPNVHTMPRVRPTVDDSAIVFVGGCDRSGTTLVSRLIAERLSLVAAPEAYFHAVAYRRFGAAATPRAALRHWRRRSWGLGTATEAPSSDAADLAPFRREQMADIVHARRGRHADLRVIESTPENIEIGSTLLERFPEAHLVHLVRDPRGVAASLRRMDFGPRSAQECARLWKQRVASGLALELRFPDRVHRLRFEDLVSMPTTTLMRLEASIPPDPAFVFEPLRDLLVDPTSVAVQRSARQTVELSKIWSWRSQLSMSNIAAVEYECRELMQLFGYELIGWPDARSSARRRFDALRSVTEELTVGVARRATRVSVAIGRERLAR